MVSIIDRLMRLLSRHFKVEKTVKGALRVCPKSGCGFSRRDWDKVTGIADKYGANVNGMGYIRVSKKRGHPGQNSAFTRSGRRSNGT